MQNLQLLSLRFIKGCALGKVTDYDDADYRLEESSSSKQIKIKMFCPSVKMSYICAKNVNNTPACLHVL